MLTSPSPMNKIVTSISALLVASTLAAGCGEETCKNICVQCEATSQADCREDCKEAYGGTADCRRKLRNLEDCVTVSACMSDSCSFELNRADDVCGFDIWDYLEDDNNP